MSSNIEDDSYYFSEVDTESTCIPRSESNILKWISLICEKILFT